MLGGAAIISIHTWMKSSQTAFVSGEKNGMPHSSKPIICICGSDNIDYIDLDKYIDPTHVGEVISGESLGIDNIARDWAFKNKIEYVEFKPNFDIWGEDAIFERDKDMIRFCDMAIIF